MARNNKRARRNRRERSTPEVSAAVKFRRKHGPCELTAGWQALEDWEKAEIRLTGKVRAMTRDGLDNREAARKHDRSGKARSVCNRTRLHDARGRICGRPYQTVKGHDIVDNMMLVRFPGDKRNATRLLDVLYKD